MALLQWILWKRLSFGHLTRTNSGVESYRKEHHEIFLWFLNVTYGVGYQT